MKKRQAKKIIAQHWRWYHQKKSTLNRAIDRYYKGSTERNYASEIVQYSRLGNWELAC